MTSALITKKIQELGSRHANIQEIGIDYFKEAEALIISCCKKKWYKINGFPMGKRMLAKDDLEENYSRRERFHLYMDKPTMELMMSQNLLAVT